MREERDDDDLLEMFPVPATDNVLTDDEPPENGPEGREGEDVPGPGPPR